jgi:hypothetical protein
MGLLKRKPACIHKWKVLDRTLFPSIVEQAGQLTTDASWLFSKKLVVIVACTKCGRLKEFVNKHP